MSGRKSTSLSSIDGITIHLGEHDLADKVSEVGDQVAKNISSLRPVIEAAIDFMATAEKQSGHSLDVNISLVKETMSRDERKKRRETLGLLCLRVYFPDNKKTSTSRKRLVSIELRNLLDDSYIGDVIMPLNRYETEFE